MRPSRVTVRAAALSGALALALAGSAVPGILPSASAVAPLGPGVTEPGAAERTLAAVEAAFDPRRPETSGGERPTRDLTMLLRDLRLQLPSLAPEDRRVASGYLARPTDDPDPHGDSYSGPADHDCGPGEPGEATAYCVHWATSGVDAPPEADTDLNGIPDQVDTTRAVMQTVWTRIVTEGGYKAPLADRAGPADGFDVYLVDIGDHGFFGYCAPEPVQGEGHDSAGFCVFDDDYAPSQYPSWTPLANLQVTAAHEFFHAVQFAYDIREDLFLAEGTATWVEDEVFDDVNDNRFYLRDSPLTKPKRPLDSSRAPGFYGDWIWWRYLSERFPETGGTGLPLVVRQVWEAADDSDPARPGAYSVRAMATVLARQDTDLTAVFARFGEANRRPADVYDEGSASEYRKAPLEGGFRLSRTRRTLPEQRTVLDHLTNRSFAFRPDPSLTGQWRLRVEVDMPSMRRQPFAQLTVYAADGSVRRRTVRLADSGKGRRTVAFGATVNRVELTLTNAARRYHCWTFGTFACEGRPLDDNLPTTFTATALR